MILVNEDIKPWMLEPATEKQIKFAEAIGRVVGFHLSKNPSKLDASVFITKHSDTYYERIAKHIRTSDANGSPYKVQIAPVASSRPPRTKQVGTDWCNSYFEVSDHDKQVREENERRKQRDMEYEIEKRALASVGIGIGPYGERYDLHEEDGEY